MKTPHLKKFVYALTAYATLLVVLGCILFSVFLFTTPWLASPNTFSIPNSKAKLSTRYFSVPNPLQPPCLRLELAQTPEQWSNGLAFRTALPENSGMLFMFPTAVKMGFGMTNVSIPLSMKRQRRYPRNCEYGPQQQSIDCPQQALPFCHSSEPGLV
jgi:hypothetical protein